MKRASNARVAMEHWISQRRAPRVRKPQEHGITVFGDCLHARAIPCPHARVDKARTLKDNRRAP
ncbi:hypothetical protein M6B38_140735 [Iris pallida]|uniref:Uncharacterized protein n=1 Tax=Iris pallida TaxID=29817 RepID=A0AAX6FDL2_IRIPA|nr:hypothetical protein M6B38_140735 [Iris pallida]